jgi:hypothetical protein
MLLASLISGIVGEPGKRTRYAAPSTVQEALRIALTVEQAENLEKSEKQPGVFFVETGVEKTYVGREKVDRSTQTEVTVKCHRCGGVGHVVRNCVTQKKKYPLRQVSGKSRDAPPHWFQYFRKEISIPSDLRSRMACIWLK